MYWGLDLKRVYTNFIQLGTVEMMIVLIPWLMMSSSERPSKKEEPLREDRRKIDPSGAPPRGGNPMPRSGPSSRGGHPLHPLPGTMGPPVNFGGSGSHKDIKLTLLNKVTIKYSLLLVRVAKVNTFPKVSPGAVSCFADVC